MHTFHFEKKRMEFDSTALKDTDFLSISILFSYSDWILRCLNF